MFKNFDLVSDLLGINNSIDILKLSETHIRPLDEVSVLNVTGLPRKAGSGLGVSFYILNQNDINAMKISKIQIQNVSGSKSSLKNRNAFLFFTIYRPLENSKHLHDNFAKSFDDMLSLVMRSFKELILLRDMNVNYLLKNDQNEAKSFSSSHGTEQLIKQPTRFDLTHKRSTLIDMIGKNNTSNVSSSCVIPLYMGYHDMTSCLRKINCKKFVPCSILCKGYRKYDQYQVTDQLSALYIFALFEQTKHIKKRVTGKCALTLSYTHYYLNTFIAKIKT